MRALNGVSSFGLLLLTAGCAQLEFSKGWHDGAMPIIVHRPFVRAEVGANCVVKYDLVTVGVEQWSVRPRGGLLGNSALTVKMDEGALTEFGQTSDTQIDELVKAVAPGGLLTNTPGFLSSGTPTCAPTVTFTPFRMDGGSTSQFFAATPTVLTQGVPAVRGVAYDAASQTTPDDAPAAHKDGEEEVKDLMEKDAQDNPG